MSNLASSNSPNVVWHPSAIPQGTRWDSLAEYTYQIVNDELEAAYQELKTVILTAAGL